MTKKYSCEVDCANCANKIENEIKKLDGIEDCNISFMTLKCKIKYDDNTNIEDLENKISKIFKKVDSDSSFNNI